MKVTWTFEDSRKTERILECVGSIKIFEVRCFDRRAGTKMFQRRVCTFVILLISSISLTVDQTVFLLFSYLHSPNPHILVSRLFSPLSLGHTLVPRALCYDLNSTVIEQSRNGR